MTAVAAGDEKSAKARDAVAAMLSNDELAEAKQMADAKLNRIFQPVSPKS